MLGRKQLAIRDSVSRSLACADSEHIGVAVMLGRTLLTGPRSRLQRNRTKYPVAGIASVGTRNRIGHVAVLLLHRVGVYTPAFGVPVVEPITVARDGLITRS